MIPIRFRLSDSEKLEYIDKIIHLFEAIEIVNFSNRIKYLLILMKRDLNKV